MTAGLTAVDSAPYLDWWQTTYGGPEEQFEGLGCFQRGKYSIWIAGLDVDLAGIGQLTEGIGIPFARLGRRHWKPAGPAVGHFGARATRGLFEASREEAAAFLAGATLPPVVGDARFEGVPRGYAIVRFEGLPIGCGLWCAEGLESNVPKGRRIESVDLPPG